MLTKDQLNQIADQFKIDTFTVFREYLQLVFLNYLYQEKAAEKIFFKGGTCLRLVYGSPRFSEDLDFSTLLTVKNLKILVKKVVTNMQKEISDIKLIFVWQGKTSLRYRISYQGTQFKYPLNIRLDLMQEKILLPAQVSQLKTDIPINFSPLILHLSKDEILAEKTRAFLIRAKGRDVFDLWYLLDRGVKLDQTLIKKKFKKVDLVFDKAVLVKKVRNYSDKRIELDLGKFLPKHYRKLIPVLKEKILVLLD